MALTTAERRELAIVAVNAAALRMSSGAPSNMGTVELASRLYTFMEEKVNG